MNCDQVFQVLTRGPFPTGMPVDVEVENHLDHCSACWRIAAALRPAHDLFEESIPAHEGRDLPGYWGDATPARRAYAEVQATAERTAALTRARRTLPAAEILPQQAPEPIGWREVVLVAGFFAVVAVVAVTLSLLWL